MNFFEESILLLAKPRVIHSIPGRLRLNVPLLKRLSKEHQHATKLLSALLKQVDGIEDVTANQISASILFHYDSQKISVEDILSFLAALSRVFMSQKDDLARLLEKDNDAVFRCLKDWLQRSVQQRLHLDISKRIVPDDFS